MIDAPDGLDAVRERIKWDLRRLNEKEKSLTHRKTELTAYVSYLERLLDEVKQANSLPHLEEIVSKAGLDTRVNPDMFKMSRYLAEKELEQKLERGTKDRETIIEEIKKIRVEKQDADLCPDCNGEGKLHETHYVREDGIVRPVLNVTTCPLCAGKGRIEY